MRKLQAGFTLVELAIVLMIIGLLIGGILKGQELIENARITSTIRQFKSYDAAVITFRDSYGAWPGDMLSPGTRLPDCSTSLACNTPGNNNGILGDAGIEMNNFWQHLAKANLISGIDFSSISSIGPKTPLNNFQITASGTWSYPFTGNWYYLNLIPYHAAQIDRKMDDGKPSTGDIWAEWESGVYDSPCLNGSEYMESERSEPSCIFFRNILN
jgi:prepilin-type N-terminal cleavage/methylation domain-containing protein